MIVALSVQGRVAAFWSDVCFLSVAQMTAQSYGKD